MSHEQSETVQAPDGSWINVYGRATPLAGQQLPGTPFYPTMEAAVKAARGRSLLEPYDAALSDIDAKIAARKNLIGKTGGGLADLLRRNDPTGEFRSPLGLAPENYNSGHGFSLSDLLQHAKRIASTPLPALPVLTKEQIAQLKASAASTVQGLAGLLPALPDGGLPMMPEWLRQHIEERGLAPYQEDGPGRGVRR